MCYGLLEETSKFLIANYNEMSLSKLLCCSSSLFVRSRNCTSVGPVVDSITAQSQSRLLMFGLACLWSGSCSFY